MFQVDEHTHSRSHAIKRLEARGVNMDLIWNQAELSANAQRAIKSAVERAKARGHRTIGSEDLVDALFSVTSLDSGARHWLTTQHMMMPPRTASTPQGHLTPNRV